MKALTTMLVERATAKMEPPTDGLRVFRDAAQEQLAGEHVIDACLFSRPSSYGASKLASNSGFLAVSLLRKTQQLRAGGLPQHFMLAVTGDEVVVLERTMTPRGATHGKPGPEVARWRRAELDVAWKPGGYLFNVTIRTPGPEGTVECCVGKSDLSASFLELLRDPSATLPAAA